MKTKLIFFLPFFLLGAITTNAQIQIGQDILGQATQDQFGNSISTNNQGNIIAVGAYLNDTGGSNAGLVRVYEALGSGTNQQWTQIGQDLTGDAPNDQFGFSLSLTLNANRLAVGAPNNLGGSTNANTPRGLVRIYDYDFNTDQWFQVGQDIQGEANGDFSGYSVQLNESGEYIAIGARQNDGSAVDGGHVRVYRFDGTQWVQHGNDIDGAEAANDSFGHDVDISNDGFLLVASAPFNDTNGSNAGMVKIYNLVGNQWQQLGFTQYGSQPDERFGNSVSMNPTGNVYAVGAPIPGQSSASGYVKVFNLSTTESQRGQTILGQLGGENFGFAIDISEDGNKLIASALGASNGQGEVRQFILSGNQWVQAGNGISGSNSNDSFGTSLDMTNNGTRVAIGASGYDFGGFTNRGVARVFDISNVPPSISNCPLDIAQNNDSNSCGATVTWTPPTASDVDGTVVTFTSSHNPGDSFPVGTTTVTYTATDNLGATATCSFDVVVSDVEPPTVVTQDITVQLDANGQANISVSDVEGSYSDNCQVSTQVLDITDFDCGDLGTNTVTVTIGDGSGNTATGTAVVTVVDNSAPTAIAQDITVQLDASGNATILPQDVDNGSTDNCSVLLTLSTSNFSCADLGQNTITLIATDPSGNSANATAVVTVQEDPNQQLTAIAQDITISLDASGIATIVPTDVDNGSGSGCNSNPTLSLDRVSFNCDDIGTNTVTLTATDGNASATATATVTVVDNLAPLVVTQNITVQLDANGQANISVSDIEGSYSDNCQISTQILDITDFDCGNLGANTVTVTIGDSSGNTATGTAIVTVVDNSIPTAIAQDITVQLDASGSATILPQDMDNGSVDNCSIANLTLDRSTFTCADLGQNTVTLTATDVSGNTATTTAIVNVLQDPNQPLVAVAQDITVQLDANGLATIAPSDVDNGSGSGCNSNPTLSLDRVSFNCDDVGANTVTLTATEGANTATATATITVVDNLAPTVTTKDITLVLDGNGQASIVPQDIDNGSGDNCTGTASLMYAMDVTSFTCNDLGDNSVQLTVTDAHGNSASATSTVTVTEETPPNVATQDIAIVLDNDGQARISATDIDNGSSDACSGIASMSLDIDTFTCPNLGDVTVTLTVTDNQGNTSTGTAIVTISGVDEDNNGIADSCENQALEVSKGFSPNGDNTNDTWMILNIEDYPNSLVQVFNRWGEKVFEKKAYQNDWDGVANQGDATKKLPVGSYFYVVRTNADGTPPVQGWLYINY